MNINMRKISMALGICGLLTSSCATLDPVTGERVYNLYSLQEEVQLGQATLKANTQEMLKSGVRINNDSARLTQISNIVKRIAAVSDIPGLPYQVTLFHTNIVNAAAAPGGSMFVFEGLYDPKIGMVQDEDEMAAVLAHEIAHVTCRHVTERLSKIMTAAAVTELASAIAQHNREDKWADAFRSVFAVGTTLYIPTYTRRDEAEADRVGLFYMAKAGYDPRAAPRIWKRVTEQSGGKKESSIFATHPSSWERYNTLTSMVPAAMQEYYKAKGRYPSGYAPGSALSK